MKFKKREIEVIKAMAENDLCLSRAARNTYTYRGVFEYHHDRIKEKTGLSVKKFYDMNKLLAMVEGE